MCLFFDVSIEVVIGNKKRIKNRIDGRRQTETVGYELAHTLCQ